MRRNLIAVALAAFLSVGALAPSSAGVHHHKTQATAPVSSGLAAAISN